MNFTEKKNESKAEGNEFQASHHQGTDTNVNNFLKCIYAYRQKLKVVRGSSVEEDRSSVEM